MSAFDAIDQAMEVFLGSLAMGAKLSKKEPDMEKLARIRLMWITAKENPQMSAFIFFGGATVGVFASIFFLTLIFYPGLALVIIFGLLVLAALSYGLPWLLKNAGGFA
jgi:hypothetical protein